MVLEDRSDRQSALLAPFRGRKIVYETHELVQHPNSAWQPACHRLPTSGRPSMTEGRCWRRRSSCEPAERPKRSISVNFLLEWRSE